jgi:hypothetical protein
MRLPVLLLCLGCVAAARADDFSVLRTWFAIPPESRGAVPADVTGTLDSPAAAARAATNVWAAYRAGAEALGWDKELPPMPPTLEALKAMPEDERPKAQPVMLRAQGKEMPMLLLAKGARGTNGWPLFLSMHGGGQSSQKVEPHGARMNTQEWQAQVRLFQTIYPPGLYLIPRMADDNDGRWWYGYCQAIYDRAIRCAILFRDADPNRVYVMGISEGGYAAYRLGAQMADRWAGSCALAAAEPLDTSPPENFRNLPFRCGIGERDTMFDRIGLARRYFARLTELRAADGATNAYVNFLDAQAGRGHGIDYREGPEWVACFARDPWPERIVWTSQPLHGVRREQMYWLALDQAPAKGPLHLTATRTGNTVNLTADLPGATGSRQAAEGITLRVYLNDTMVNLDQPVTVRVNGKTVHEGKAPRRVATLARSLNERGDPCYCFPAEVEVKL